MLISYEFKNFTSFKDEVNFSMKAGRMMERFKNNVVRINGHDKILKTAVIVGENGGGKSNFIKSMDYLQYLFQENEKLRTVNKLVNAHKESLEQHFKLEVLAANDYIYNFELILDNFSIVKEVLKYKKNGSGGKFTNLYKMERKGIQREKYKAGVTVLTDLNIADFIIPKNMQEAFKSSVNAGGLIATRLALVDTKYILPFVEWMREALIIEAPSMAALALYRQLKAEEDDIRVLHSDSYKEIFRLIDPSIQNIVVDNEKPFEDSVLVRNDDNGNEFTIKIKDESSGIKEYFAWAIYIWRVIYENKVLFADEMDRVLNPILSDKVIAYLHGMEHHGQFIFTTHNVLHLNTVNFMKHQLWFVNKRREDLTSEMYSLADFPEFRYDKANIYDWYLKGILGGTPDE